MVHFVDGFLPVPKGVLLSARGPWSLEGLVFPLLEPWGFYLPGRYPPLSFP